jgi:AraC family transcriptional regulator
MLQVAEVDYPPGLQQSRHWHPAASVTLLLAGSLEERAGSRSERGLPLSVVVKPAGVEHDDRFGSAGARTVQIGVSAEAARELERRGEVLDRWRWIPVGTAVAPFLRLIEAIRAAMPSGELQDRAWDVLGSLGVADSVAFGSGGPAPGWLRSVREQVDDSPQGGHRVRELARSAGVHPVHLARSFRRHYGTTMSDYLQRRRLQAAAQLVVSSDEPIALAAARAGFADQSHFGRQLRARAGITPQQLRRAAHPARFQKF